MTRPLGLAANFGLPSVLLQGKPGSAKPGSAKPFPRFCRAGCAAALGCLAKDAAKDVVASHSPSRKVISNLAVSSSALISDFVLESFHLGKKSVELVFSFGVHVSFLPF